MIKPTVGRMVWFHPHTADPSDPPLAAIVTYVDDEDEPMINIAFFTPEGASRSAVGVQLYQGEGDRPAPGQRYAEWMPYQLAQAKAQEPQSDDADDEIADPSAPADPTPATPVAADPEPSTADDPPPSDATTAAAPASTDAPAPASADATADPTAADATTTADAPAAATAATTAA